MIRCWVDGLQHELVYKAGFICYKNSKDEVRKFTRTNVAMLYTSFLFFYPPK